MYGTLINPENQKIVYQGEWLDGKYHGTGLQNNLTPSNQQMNLLHRDFDLLANSWSFYEGQFVNDYWQGSGMLLLKNGDKFVGNFKQG